MPSSLLTAYRKTNYVTENTPVGPVVLRPGETCRELGMLIDYEGLGSKCSTAAFVTAYNPFGEKLTDAENAERHERLLKVVRNGSWPSYVGEGVGDDHSDWDPEKSVLILGISRDDAVNLGVQFEQNAIVFTENDDPAEILLLR